MTRSDPSQSGDSIRVLHVDDESNQLEFAKTFIEFSDPAILMEPVTTPKEALDRLRDENYDCIVSDYQMHGMDGIELAGKIREASDVPIIIYTGRGSEEVAEAAFTVGANDYLRKEMNPSHYQVLARRIRVAAEKYRGERALQKQLQEMQIILDSVPAIIFYKDKENRLVKVNQALIDSSGLSREMLEGRDLADVYPDLAEDYWKDDLEVIDTGQAKLGIIEPLETPGGMRWLTTDKIPYRDEQREVAGVIGFSIDITERKQLEDENILHLTRLDVLHDHVAEMASAMKLDGVVEKTFEAIGKTLEADVGSFHIVEGEMVKPIYSEDIRLSGLKPISVEGPGIVARAVREVASQLVPDTRSDPDFITGPEEKEIELLSELAVPVIIDGRVEAVINIQSVERGAFDSNDQRLVEILADHVASAISRIRRMDELEKAIEDRELAERELLEHTETLSEAVEKKTREVLELELISAAGKVSAMVGHDLRGPLQTIKNALYIMERNPEEGAELRKAMGEAVDYAAGMLEELRLNVGDTPLQLREVNLEALIRKAVEEAPIPDSVSAEVQVDDGLDSVSMDPLKIRRVLDNLVMNAVQAMPDGGTLGVSAVCEGDVVSIRVKDTGTGIPEELMSDLFKAFVTTKPLGMGLGLAYCKRAVEAHDGTISVDSKVGEGTTFTVRLPANPEIGNGKDRA
jgi:PAS domain S-box-containing protein